MVGSGGSRPLTSYILQEFLRFADSWATRLSIFFAMTGSFIHILIGLGAPVTGIVVFNLAIFSLGIACSLYAYKVDPALNTMLIIYSGFFALTYFSGFLSLIDLPSFTGGPEPLESMQNRLQSRGYNVESFTAPGSDIPSFKVTEDSTTYRLHCLHNQRYDSSYFSTRVKGNVIDEVRDAGYHCKIQSDDAVDAPTRLKEAIVNGPVDNHARRRPGEDQTSEERHNEDDENRSTTENKTEEVTADQELADTDNTTTNQTLNTTNSTGEDTDTLTSIKQDVADNDYEIELLPTTPEVNERVEASFENESRRFDGRIEWSIDGILQVRGRPGSLYFDEAGSHEVSATLSVDGYDAELVLDEKTVTVEEQFTQDREQDEDTESTGYEDESEESVVVEPVPANPRIAYWCGKVNQHREDGEWQTDPDGVSGCDENKLDYCQRFYPDTVRVEEAGEERITDWRNGGNTGSFTSTKMTYRCVQS